MYIRAISMAFCLTSTVAMRVQPSRGAVKEAIGVPGEQPVDVTALINTPEFEKSGYDCCCDKRKEGDAGKADDDRGIDNESRANYCAIAYTWPLGKCGNVKVASDTKMAHNYKSTGGTCTVLRENFAVLAAALKKPDYCPSNVYEFSGMQVDIPAAAIGKTSKAPCPDGSQGKVTCQVGTQTVGYWGGVVCGGEPTWCPATVKNEEEGAPAIFAGKIDAEHYIDCFQSTPSTGTTKCSAKGWIPRGRSSGWEEDGLPPVCLKQD